MARTVRKVRTSTESIEYEDHTVRREEYQSTEFTREATSIWGSIGNFFLLALLGAVLQIVAEIVIRYLLGMTG